jgi:hypothetical protein
MIVEESLAKKIINCLAEQNLTYKVCAQQFNISESIIKAAVKQEEYE